MEEVVKRLKTEVETFRKENETLRNDNNVLVEDVEPSHNEHAKS